MSRRLATIVCGTLVALVVVLAGPRGAQADDGGVARDLLVRSRDAASEHEFDGTVVIEWHERGQRHERTVSVHVSKGVLRMGGDRLVSAGTRRLMRTNTGWQVLWAVGSVGSEPDPTRKYRFVVSHSVSIAQRSATQVAIGRLGSSGVRERLFFDDATGMLLRRDQLDARGRLVRRFAFLKMSRPRTTGASKTDVLPKISRQSRLSAPQALQHVPDDLRSPKRIGEGFVLSGVYSHPDGSVQLYYSDGLLGLSVFERAGQLEWDALPAGGRTVELGDVRARVYRSAAGSAVVWGNHDVTYTCVTDAPLDEVAAVATKFSRSDQPGVLEDIGRFVTAPFSWG